jgi:hypothetical protein
MTTIETKVENSLELFLLAAKECGFESIEDIEENFEIITTIALSMVESSRDKILTKLATNSHLIFQLAAKYKLKVLENN